MKKEKLCLLLLVFGLCLNGCSKINNATSTAPTTSTTSTSSTKPTESTNNTQPSVQNKTAETRITKDAALYDLQGVTDAANITLLSEQTLTSKDFIVEGPNDFKSDNNFAYLYGPKGSSTPTYIVNGNTGSVYKCSTKGKAAGKLVIALAQTDEEQDLSKYYLTNDTSALVQKMPLTDPEKVFLGHWYNKDAEDNIWVSKTAVNESSHKFNIKNKTYGIEANVISVRKMTNSFVSSKIINDFNLYTSQELWAEAKFNNEEISNSMILSGSGNSNRLDADLFIFSDDRKSAKVYALGYPGTHDVDFLGIFTLVDDKQSP